MNSTRRKTWLARTPFLDWGGGTFREAYRTAVENHLTRDAELVRTDPAITPEKRDRELKNIERAIASFSEIFSGTDEGRSWRLLPQSVQAAVFITVREYARHRRQVADVAVDDAK